MYNLVIGDFKPVVEISLNSAPSEFTVFFSLKQPKQKFSHFQHLKLPKEVQNQLKKLSFNSAP